MIVYHGSNHNFRTLRLCPKYTGQSTKENEGVGIYFSPNRQVAESYGKYIYTLDVSDDTMIDFRKEYDTAKYVNRMLMAIWNKTKVDIWKYLDVPSIVESVVNGDICISDLGERDIYLILDSTEAWYTDGLPEWKRQSVYRVLRQEDQKLQVYMFPYHIKDIGVIKDVSTDVVKIVGKERNPQW